MNCTRVFVSMVALAAKCGPEAFALANYPMLASKVPTHQASMHTPNAMP